MKKRSYKGTRTVLSLRIQDDIYEEASLYALLNDMTLTDYIVDAIKLLNKKIRIQLNDTV